MVWVDRIVLWSAVRGNAFVWHRENIHWFWFSDFSYLLFYHWRMRSVTLKVISYSVSDGLSYILCSWFRSSLIYINNCPNKMQHKAVYLLFCKFTLHVSGVNHKKIWPVPEAVVTVLCTPDDGCGWRPKHVEWTCRIISRLLCVASCWTNINIDQRCTES